MADLNFLKDEPLLFEKAKAATLSFEKSALPRGHKAKVALVMDISASMGNLYANGAVQQLAERALAQGFVFDDDGQIDTFTFGARAHETGEIGVRNYKGWASKQAQNLEGATYYAGVMNKLRAHYASQIEWGQTPVYVIFVTDGDNADKLEAEREIQAASGEPIFWQFMAVGGARCSFLEKLDEMGGRIVDNANFFSVTDPTRMSDEKFFDLMMAEYPAWFEKVSSMNLVGPSAQPQYQRGFGPATKGGSSHGQAAPAPQPRKGLFGRLFS